MEAELKKLSQAELCQIRECLDDMIEDELQFTPEFERAVEQAESDMTGGKNVRVREPEGSWARLRRFITQVSTLSFLSCHQLFRRALKRKLTKSVRASDRFHIIG